MIDILDFTMSPGLIVVATDNVQVALDIGQRYSTAVGRPIIAADGPGPDDPTYEPQALTQVTFRPDPAQSELQFDLSEELRRAEARAARND